MNSLLLQPARITRHRLVLLRPALSVFSQPRRSFSSRRVVVQHHVSNSANHATVEYECGNSKDSSSWQQVSASSSQKNKQIDLVQTFQDYILLHFLPANHETSVAPGYTKFALFGFGASIAGSTSMVLSTQTLLLAVGVVGSAGVHASVLAGALNWVLKDGIGQAGGVLFASMVGQSHLFDNSPRTWRMVAALSLDAATLLEILSPMVPSFLVLPVASIANIGKNIGFLTASASRAALHQSLAISGNLGDVTAKSGSQSMAASLFGTTIGIGISPLLGDVPHFCMGFVGLSALHLGLNYLALKQISLRHLDRHRLHILLEHHVETGGILTPRQVSEREVFFPGVKQDDTHSWLTIGSPLETLCPDGPTQLQELQNESGGKARYLINTDDNDDDTRIHLVFFKDASGKDVIEGMLHAHYRNHGQEAIAYNELAQECETLVQQMQQMGWKTGDDDVNVESRKAYRLSIL